MADATTSSRLCWQHHCGTARLGFVIADEALRLGSLVGLEIVRPAKADGLIPEFGADMEGAGTGGSVDHVADRASLIGEVWIVKRIADHGDVLSCGVLVKAAGEKAIVLEIGKLLVMECLRAENPRAHAEAEADTTEQCKADSEIPP